MMSRKGPWEGYKRARERETSGYEAGVKPCSLQSNLGLSSALESSAYLKQT